jgi:RimJ/RimL family protein N-acetyltransferase
LAAGGHTGAGRGSGAPARAFLSGPRLHLRELRPADAGGRYLAWVNDPEVTRHLEIRAFPKTAAALSAVIAAPHQDRDRLSLAIVLDSGRRHIGNIHVGPIDWIHRHADVRILIGENDAWAKGYATEAIRLVVDHAFRALNLHRLTASCYSVHEPSVAAFERAGFVREGIRRDHFRAQGRYVDAVMLGIARPPVSGRADP